MATILTAPFLVSELVNVKSMADAIAGNPDPTIFHKVTILESGLLGSGAYNDEFAVIIDGYRQAFVRGDALAEKQFRELLGGLLNRDQVQSERALAYIAVGLSSKAKQVPLKTIPLVFRCAAEAYGSAQAWSAISSYANPINTSPYAGSEIRVEGVNQGVTAITVPSPDYALIEELSGGMMLTNAVHVGLKLGIFDIMKNGPMTCAQIAEELRLNERPVFALLTAYVSIGLIKQNGENTYLLNPEASASLLIGSPDFIGANLDHFAQLWMRARAGQKEELLELALAYETVENKKIYGVTTAANMILAQKFKLFELLAATPQSLTNISSALGVDIYQAQSIVRTLYKFGLISETSVGFYSLTPVAKHFLNKQSPFYYGIVIDLLMAPVNVTTVDDLEESVREDKPIISRRGNIWKDYMDDGEAALFFGNYMFQTSYLPGLVIANNTNFRQSNLLLDVAGGSGAIAIAILKNNPHLRATVTDIGPPMLNIAKQKAAELGVANRMNVAVSDMFKDTLPAGADVVLLSQIIHDWRDDTNKALLKKIYDYLPTGGRILIHERLLNNEKNGPRVTVQQNLFMLLWTEGRQRTQKEIEEMLNEVGFQPVRVLPTAAGFSLIEAVK